MSRFHSHVLLPSREGLSASSCGAHVFARRHGQWAIRYCASPIMICAAPAATPFPDWPCTSLMNAWYMLAAVWHFPCARAAAAAFSSASSELAKPPLLIMPAARNWVTSSLMLLGVTTTENVTDRGVLLRALSTAVTVKVWLPSVSSVSRLIAWPLASPCPATVVTPSSGAVTDLRRERSS